MADCCCNRLEGKVALVTGASRGIGRGIALAFAREGADVAVNYVRSAAKAEEVVQDILKMGRRAMAVQADVAKRDQVERMFGQVLAEFGRVDVLVNNAGLQIWKSCLEISEDEWDETIDTDLKGTFLCSQLAARDMVKRGQGGKIINITSIQDVRIVPPHVNYHAAKAGQLHLTRSFATELGQYGINVNAIGPGATDTDMANLHSLGPKWMEEFQARLPLRRVGTPEDCAHAAVFLASHESDYITGTVIYVDGGLMLESN